MIRVGIKKPAQWRARNEKALFRGPILTMELDRSLPGGRGFPLHRTLPFHTNDMQTGLIVSP
jgi:hypothetical protein